MVRKLSSLVEEVRHLSALGAFGKRGKLSFNEALNLVADKYRLSRDPKDYEFIVLKAVHANVPNNNGDAFPLEELKRFDERYGCYVYQTFILKPHFIEHRQDGEPYGFVLDAHLEEPKEGNPYVELVIAVDITKDPVYGMKVKQGTLGKYSMGCTVEYTECSICKNRAYNESQFCQHIREGKMKKYKVADENGNEVEKLAYENCYGVVYDEISAVAEPADEEALEEERLKVATNKKFAQTETPIRSVPPPTPGVSSPATRGKEEGWLLKLSEDIKSGKVPDVTKVKDWFRDRYKREPDSLEIEAMEKLFKSASMLKQALDVLRKLGNDANYYLWRNQLRRLGFSDLDIRRVEREGVLKRLWKIVEGSDKRRSSLTKIAPKRPPKDWFYRCVRRVREEGTADDPEALCGWIYHHQMKPETKREIEKGGSFNLSSNEIKRYARIWNLINRNKKSKISGNNKKDLSLKLFRDRLIKGGIKMAEKEYFIEAIDKKASTLRYPGYRNWKVWITNDNGIKIAKLGYVKDTPFSRRILKFLDEQKFAESVLNDLVQNGLEFTVKKYGFIPRSKAITENNITDKQPGSLGIKSPRLSEGGVADKKEYPVGRFVERKISEEGVLDKADSDKTYTEKTSPKLSAKGPIRRPLILGKNVKGKEHETEYKLKVPVYEKARELIRHPIRETVKTVMHPFRTLHEITELPYIEKKESNLKPKYLKVGKLADTIISFYKKYHNLSEKDAKLAFAKCFSKSARIANLLRIKKAQDVIEENVEQIDVPGLVEEVVNFYIIDQNMNPSDATDTVVQQFVLEETPEEVKEQIAEEVADIAKAVAEEVAPKEEPGKEVSPPVKEEVEEVKEEVEELKDKVPTMEEMGIVEEEIEARASKKAQEMVDLFKKKFLRALRVASLRQLLNLEKEGLFDIKVVLGDYLSQPNPAIKFAGLSRSTIVDLVERAFQDIAKSDYLDKLFASALKLSEMSDEAFVQLENDVKNLSPAPLLVERESLVSKENDVPLISRTGSGLTVDEEDIRSVLPYFGIK